MSDVFDFGRSTRGCCTFKFKQQWGAVESTSLSAPPTPPVLVTGDVFQDHLLYTGHVPWPNATREQGTRTVDSSGGAALLADVLSKLLEGTTVTHGPN